MLLGLCVFAVYPFFYLIGLAFTESSLARIFQEWTGFANFAEALDDERYVRSLFRSVAVAFLSTAIAMVLGVAVAVLLDKAVRARDLLRTLILLPLLTPPVTVAIDGFRLSNVTSNPDVAVADPQSRRLVDPCRTRDADSARRAERPPSAR